MVLWVVTVCNDAVGYQHFRGPCSLHLNNKSSSQLKP